MINKAHQFGFDTKALHSGHQPDEATGSRAVPIYQTTSYVFDNTDHAANLFALQEFGNIYTRINNPTTAVLEERIAVLENGSAGVATASGMAAQFLVIFALCMPGDEIVSSGRLYGGTFTQFDVSLKKLGVQAHFVDPDLPSNFEKAITPKTKALFIETIGNPLGNIPDIESIAKIADQNGIPLIVDNTFGTPYLCRPLEFGAHIIVHSATKFLGGHGNSIGGLIVDGGNFDWGNGKFPTISDPSPAYHGLKFWENFRECAFAMKVRTEALRDVGACISPMNVFLILLGVETLSLRMERHSANAFKIAEFLKEHSFVEWVYYPALKDSKYFPFCEKYLKGKGGAIFTFGIKGGREAGKKMIESMNLFSHLANVGDIRSLIIHPASTTHQQLSDKDLITAGVKPEMIRISVGLEDSEDLIWDLENGLKASQL